MLAKSTARNLMVFLTASSDHVTGLTGATLAVTLSKDGAAFASISPTITERGNGWYNVALTAGHTDTVGDLVMRATAASADPIDLREQVVEGLPAANFGALSITAAGRVDVAAVAGTAQTARDLGAQLDAAVSTRMASYTQPTGFLAATFPGTVASPTNITAGTIATVSGNVAGSVGSVTGNVGGNVAGSVGSVTGLNASLLDVAVSTRSTYAGADTAGTTTLLGRLSSGRAAALDNLDAAVSTRSTYGGGDTPGTTTLLSRLTSPRAANLDNLDVAISTRMATGSVTLDAAGREAIADAILLRSIATGANGGRTVRDALRFLRNRWGVATGTLTVYEEDDTTAAWTAPVTASPGADPITGIDPV